jgi:multiple antibiotic resistance protein
MTTFSWKSLFHLVFLFWIVMDALGTLPIFVSLLKHFNPKKQRTIIIRELSIALGIMIIFLFFGHGFFKLLRITPASLQMAGGIILFLLAIKMIFSKPGVDRNVSKVPKDPLIVPLAVPLIAGPGILATIALYAGGIESTFTVFTAIVLAWFFTFLVLLTSPFLNKLFGENGVIAIERLFGFVLVLIATQMTVNGLTSFIHP